MAFEDTLKSISLNADSSIAGFTGVSGLAAGGGPSNFFKISSITGTDTINTATNHGLSVGDVVYIANNSTAANNGGFTVTSIGSATSFKTGATYTNTSASGTVNKTNFNQLYRFVKTTGAKTAGLCTAATDYVIGVLQSKPQYTGAAAQVGFVGVSYVITGSGVSGTNLAAGDRVVSDTTGAAVKWVADAAYTTTPKVIAGVALASSSTPGELIPVLLAAR